MTLQMTLQTLQMTLQGGDVSPNAPPLVAALYLILLNNDLSNYQ